MRAMCKRVKSMTLAELRRELELIPVWIRDLNEQKRARLRDISREIERRSAKTSTEPT